MKQKQKRLIQYADQKVYTRGTMRTRYPQETWNLIKPLLPAIGVTRLANVTGLDAIGIPVFMACRPNSRSLAVFHGKGIETEAARVSAAMEAVETWHAETIDLPLKFSSFEELRYTHSIANPTLLPLSFEKKFDPLEQMLWVEAKDIVTHQNAWLPFELVHANYTLPQAPGSGAFRATTNGLASGNTYSEALCHALYEVVERDAVTLWTLKGREFQGGRCVDLSTIDDETCKELIRKISEAGLDIVVWDVSSDIDVAVYYCLIAERNRTTGAAEVGAGAHLCKEIALSRALTEAVQSRLTYIAGSREDITALDYEDAIKNKRQKRAREIVESAIGIRSFHQSPSFKTKYFKDDLDKITAALQAVGLESVLAVNLSKPAFNIAVVRVIVPGLEGAIEGPNDNYVPGNRANAVMEFMA